MTDTFEELRIIAKDGGHLDALDRAVIERAADELEFAQLLLITTQAALIESQSRRIATNEVVAEMRRKLVPPPVVQQSQVWRVSWEYPTCLNSK